MPKIEEIIESEIAEFKIRFGTEWRLSYFRDFDFRLIEGPYRWGLRMFQNLPLGQMDIYNQEEGYSELFLSQTPLEFIASIDKAIADCGLTTERMHELRFQRENLNELYDYTFPAYVHLRKLGYSKQELSPTIT
ncbi:MAG: hypothetical protein ABIJ34_07820 [archaeon]